MSRMRVRIRIYLVARAPPLLKDSGATVEVDIEQ